MAYNCLFLVGGYIGELTQRVTVTLAWNNAWEVNWLANLWVNLHVELPALNLVYAFVLTVDIWCAKH